MSRYIIHMYYSQSKSGILLGSGRQIKYNNRKLGKYRYLKPRQSLQKLEHFISDRE